MLVLSRKRGETIRVGDGITIRVVHIRPGVVRLGIDAPKDVACHRGEVYDRIRGGRARRADATGRGTARRGG